MRRHREITPRTPEATSAARARGFNRIVAGKFFDMYIYESLMDKNHFAPHNIYNVDKTGVTTEKGTGAKILALKGRRKVGSLTSTGYRCCMYELHGVICATTLHSSPTAYES